VNEGGLKMAQISYKKALEWIINNDDTEWLDTVNDHFFPSVTGCLIADLFGKDIYDVTRDLIKLRSKKDQNPK
jgi:uncharacterized protein YxjI